MAVRNPTALRVAISLTNWHPLGCESSDDIGSVMPVESQRRPVNNPVAETGGGPRHYEARLP